MFRLALAALVVAVGGPASCGEGEGSELYPWTCLRRTILPNQSEKIEGAEDWSWQATGSPYSKVTALSDGLKWDIAVRKMPDWPSITVFPNKHVDFKGGVLRFRMRAFRQNGGACPVAVILDGKDGQRTHLALKPTPVGDGKWRLYEFDPGDDGWQGDVRRLHFYVSTESYVMGESLFCEIDGFRRGCARHDLVSLPGGLVGSSLWLGQRAEANDSMVIVNEGDGSLRATLHLENRLGRLLPPEARVRFRLRNVFSEWDTFIEVPLGVAVADGTRGKAVVKVPVATLPSGYYHALADMLFDGRSVSGIFKGSDDFYVRRAGESDAEMVLGIRLGMTNWIMDRVHGGGMGPTRIALPHTYDPYDSSESSYSRLIRLAVYASMKNTEWYEAGVSGLAIAAEAYRRLGDGVRENAAEKLIWNCCESMFAMQDDCGAALMIMNELKDIDGYGTGVSGHRRNSQYYADQVGEWMRALTYAAGYYLRRGETAKLRLIVGRLKKAGAFIMANCRQDSDGISGVLRALCVVRNKDGSFRRDVYHQEMRFCDVYQPRVASGLAYAATLLTMAGEKVPDEWWQTFDATARWMDAKMKDNGWFDWRCGDDVEEGCHTFLGNIYAGEALYGIGIADRKAGRVTEAAVALAAAHRAYRYVTDHCVVRGKKYEAVPEFWTGPYIYWLFSDWRANVGSEPVFGEWLAALDHVWRVKCKWHDFLRVPGYACGRADHNCMLNTAILGYLGIRVMEDRGLHWKLFD